MKKQKDLGEHKLYVRIWTLLDKKTMFRSKRPDRYVVELSAKLPSKTVIIREDFFEDEAKAKAHFESYVNALLAD